MRKYKAILLDYHIFVNVQKVWPFYWTAVNYEAVMWKVRQLFWRSWLLLFITNVNGSPIKLPNFSHQFILLLISCHLLQYKVAHPINDVKSCDSFIETDLMSLFAIQGRTSKQWHEKLHQFIMLVMISGAKSSCLTGLSCIGSA